ncbi:hypothetical protein KQI52_16615 [bacterium]|nr:hypothetical protein [bacterium]
MKRILTRILLILPLLVLLLLGVAAATQSAESGWTGDTDDDSVRVAPEPTAALMEFHNALAREEYAEARAVVDRLKSMDDLTIRPWMRMLRASLTVTVAIDFGVEEKENLFHSDVKIATKAFEWTLKQEQDDASDERLASLYAALGTLMLLNAQWENEIDGDLLKSATMASDGYTRMKKAYRLDESRMDALLGTAAYRFFRSHTLKFITWMPFIKDDREDALEDMRRVIQTPGPAQPGAVTTLAWSLIEMGRPDEAVTACEPWLMVLDNPRHLLEPYAKAQFVAENWADAKAAYDLYITKIKAAPVLNTERLLGALSRALQSSKPLNDWEAIAAYADEALSQPLSEDEWREFDDFRDGFEEYKAKAAERLGGGTGE